MLSIKPPYLGVAYYPEDWDMSEIDKDIEKMVSIGINVARIGEFAWRKMEPRDGEFDFSWLHYVVEKLKSAGIAVVMEQILKFKELGCNDTTLITHIPINAYLAAAKAAFKNLVVDKSISFEDSCNPDLWNDGYKDSYGVLHEPITAHAGEDGVFDLVCELESTKNILCGHNHVNNWVVKYNGVRFAFATKTGCGSYWEPGINGGTVLDINENGVVSLHHEFVDVSEFL